MARLSKTRLQTWAKTLLDDEECLNEVRDRFQLRMLDIFRAANREKRDEINSIMDNEKLFFEELHAIVAEIGEVNVVDESDAE